jgi:glycosyltransferase involved in cell wall biosynthesis
MEKKINVLILVDKFDYHGSFINGPTRNYSWLIKRIDRNDFNVFLYALRAKGKSCEIFKNESVDIKYLGLGKYNPLTPLIILYILIKNKIDILHLQGYGSVFFGQLAAAMLRKPTIIKEEWVDPNISFIHRIQERFITSFADRVIAISNYSKDFLIAKKGVKESKIVLIPNGIPLDVFRDADVSASRKIRHAMGISENDVVVGIVGMLHENKGHKYFIEAASLILPKIPNTKFVIIGDGELRQELEDYVQQLRLTNNFFFMGHQDNMPELYKMLDIYVISSVSETWPTSLMEAMAAGRAIITTDCGGGSEIVDDEDSGIVVPVKNSEILAKKIEYLIEHPKIRETIGENALRESKRFDIDQTVLAVEKLYRNCILN